ncbi:MAG: Formate dehydrogenase-O, major subunit [Ktedonobacterales bacterium]|jgi:anaerobic selenocysteine-containing dehydrogenase|nr:MAG: Formate dehydrogenase-O, major subunit [Ktedonobacterales bacterium]
MTPSTPEPSQVTYATCPLCEATCGLEITTTGRQITGIRGDPADVFSHGYICPKAYSLKELDADPDRLRGPMLRQGGQWRAVSWDDAFAEIARRLTPIQQQYGRDAVAVYLGNPNVHNLSGQLYNTPLLRALGTRNIYTASTLDQMPKQVSAGYMFGTMLSIPIPDVDRADYLLILGANPLVSNGSLMTAPDMRGRIRALLARGGRVVVVDPRRTRTAAEASEHLFIHPGTDPHFLFALVHTLFAEGLVNPAHLTEHLNGIEELRALAAPFTPEAVAATCGITPDVTRRIARELATAPRAAVYTRIGACTQQFGTLTSWLGDVLNALTGNLDRPGGALFPRAAAGARNTSGLPGTGKGIRPGFKKSRVRGLPQIYGELPTVCLAEEITTPGDGQVRALITIAGNPALSAPNGDRLNAALGQLDFMVSVDCYLNETTRHADVILPPPSPLQRAHYDLAFYQLSIRNIAHYSPPVFPRESGQLDEWEILLRLTAIAAGQDATIPAAVIDDMVASQLVQREVRTAGSPVEGRDSAELLAALQPRRGPERLLDFLLRTGPYGDAFGARPDGLTLAQLEAAPHGIDLGPLQPRIPEVLRTPSGKVELAPPLIVADVERLRAALDHPRPPVVLIGRRDLRSNNSWMHNLHVLVKGDDPCVLLVHPQDAARLNLAEGVAARVTSAAGSVAAPVHITDEMMPGVVSLPHGWGHGVPGSQMRIAAEHAGVSINRLIPDDAVDPLSGNAILNAIPVTLAPVK